MASVVVPGALSDPNYQIQKAALSRSLKDFQAGQGVEKAQYRGQYNQNARRLGYSTSKKKWDPTIPNSEYGQATQANANDYAGRGLTFSGENVKSRNDINQYYNTQLGDLNRGLTDFSANQAQALRAYQTQQEVVRQQAQMAAIATIAAKYGIDLGQVGRGTASRTVNV